MYMPLYMYVLYMFIHIMYIKTYMKRYNIQLSLCEIFFSILLFGLRKVVALSQVTKRVLINTKKICSNSPNVLILRII